MLSATSAGVPQGCQGLPVGCIQPHPWPLAVGEFNARLLQRLAHGSNRLRASSVTLRLETVDGVVVDRSRKLGLVKPYRMACGLTEPADLSSFVVCGRPS